MGSGPGSGASKESREDSSVLQLIRPAPRRIGRYDICFEIAAGGMATIYLARAEGPGGFKKLVALKCIHPHLVRQQGFVEMFLDEARLASRISHPNVCSVFDFGFADSTYYIAMEFLVGETVSRLCRLSQQHPELTPMPAHAAVASRIIADAAAGLHAAHELYGDDGEALDVVHRDVSPQNLMVTYDGAVKIMDFGIARTMDQLHLTRTGTVRGKFPYMAPEQIEQGGIDRRADIWSLGVVFWELLTGTRLFHREREVDSIRAVLQGPITAPSTARSGIPKELDEIVMHALQRDPARRFATARELALAIEATRARREALPGQGVLAERMRQFFPDLYARRLELVDQARQMGEGSVPRISRALSESTIDTRRLNTAQLDTGWQYSRLRPRVGWGVGVIAALAAVGIGYAGWAGERGSAGERVGEGESERVGERVGEREREAESERERVGEDERAREMGAQVETAEQVRGAREVRSGREGEEAATAAGASTGVSPGTRAASAAEREQDPAGRAQAASEQALAPPRSGAGHARAQSSGAQAEGARRVLGRGFVNIATPGGWADVFVSGRHRGRTPVQVEIPEGQRTVVLRPFGGRPIRRSVLVRRAQVTRLVVPVH